MIMLRHYGDMALSFSSEWGLFFLWEFRLCLSLQFNCCIIQSSPASNYFWETSEVTSVAVIGNVALQLCLVLFKSVL